MPTLEKFTPRLLGPKPWGEEWLIAETPTYIGKVLLMKAGHQGALQYHEQKDETFYLFSGRAIVASVDADGTETQTDMLPGESYHVPVGAPHRVTAIDDCVFFEASTPHFDDRVILAP